MSSIDVLKGEERANKQVVGGSDYDEGARKWYPGMIARPFGCVMFTGNLNFAPNEEVGVCYQSQFRMRA